MAAFDLETTGVDVEADRIVSAAVMNLDGAAEPEGHEWLVDPGVEIPVEASAVHGITTERARAEGGPRHLATEQIVGCLAELVRAGAVVVGHNVPFDLTLLDRECRRYALVPLLDRLGDAPLHVIDTRVLDTHALPYRKRPSETQGARQLITLAQVYGLPWDEDEAHGSTYDALMSARIAYRIGQLAHMPRRYWPNHIKTFRRPRFHELRDLDRAELHALQIRLAAEQAAGLERHFRKTDPTAAVDRSWPFRPWAADTESKGVPA
ncbi:DNA polymerase III subunit epsilon [Streptomyces sp. WAC 01529]|uniref:exonuclease domain-containing protein n=1 Tax=Streptomyces sp. WAC 01529 TaxID=2203205 RepID=UPI000F6BE730|nr:exonuclease domain-containing protein [Streptomyces sp. WAC 01529]AZM57624.1 DNA polymerase III subunit epsilon [Streptomyces sp. WAC 01529]